MLSTEQLGVPLTAGIGRIRSLYESDRSTLAKMHRSTYSRSSEAVFGQAEPAGRRRRRFSCMAAMTSWGISGTEATVPAWSPNGVPPCGTSGSGLSGYVCSRSEPSLDVSKIEPTAEPTGELLPVTLQIADSQCF
jgi:hypothetical protein